MNRSFTPRGTWSPMASKSIPAPEPLDQIGANLIDSTLSRLANPEPILPVRSVAIAIDHFLTASSDFEKRIAGPSMFDTLMEMNVQIART